MRRLGRPGMALPGFLLAPVLALVLLACAGCGSRARGVVSGSRPAAPVTGSAPVTASAVVSDSAQDAGAAPVRDSAPVTGSATPAAVLAGRWVPRPGTPWQYQLSGTIDQSVDVPVFDVDAFTTPASTVASLHAKSRKVICYVSVGSWEPYRPDSGAFPAWVKGKPVEGFEDERWLDIRRQDILLPLMAARFDLCRSKGFDGVEPDLVEAYANKSGFPITADDQLAYNRAIARLAHARGLSVGLKNDLGQIPSLVWVFDFSVNEQCAQYHECDALTPFIKLNKAVFHVEYDLPPTTFCPVTTPLHLSSMKKDLALDAPRDPC